MAIAITITAGAVQAADAPPVAPSAALEARLKKLETELRCLVCQNQTLADSNADLASDLRREVRELALAGKNDAEIRDYLVARYGDFVLYDPPLKRTTWLLWFGPLPCSPAAAWCGGRSCGGESVRRPRHRPAIPPSRPARARCSTTSRRRSRVLQGRLFVPRIGDGAKDSRRIASTARSSPDFPRGTSDRIRCPIARARAPAPPARLLRAGGPVRSPAKPAVGRYLAEPRRRCSTRAR
jgi:cytochrome c-type biogenesis protein CcmH/NrfF